MQTREYIKANDAYLRLSIGNAPWPIGVTMVGIHERSGREKIFSNNVAHVLNDEVSRKYIQSLKRSFILFSPHTSNPTSPPPPKKKYSLLTLMIRFMIYNRILTFAQTKRPPDDLARKYVLSSVD